MPFTLPALPYKYDALEPHIDAKTMEIHSQKHHKAYVDNLNKALESAPDFANLDIVKLLRDIKKVPDSIRQAVINNGGGHHNHSLFWEIMGPGGGGEPAGAVADAIKAAFGDFATLKTKVKENGSLAGTVACAIIHRPAARCQKVSPSPSTGGAKLIAAPIAIGITQSTRKRARKARNASSAGDGGLALGRSTAMEVISARLSPDSG